MRGWFPVVGMPMSASIWRWRCRLAHKWCTARLWDSSTHVFLLSEDICFFTPLGLAGAEDLPTVKGGQYFCKTMTPDCFQGTGMLPGACHVQMPSERFICVEIIAIGRKCSYFRICDNKLVFYSAWFGGCWSFYQQPRSANTLVSNISPRPWHQAVSRALVCFQVLVTSKCQLCVSFQMIAAQTLHLLWHWRS